MPFTPLMDNLLLPRSPTGSVQPVLAGRVTTAAALVFPAERNVSAAAMTRGAPRVSQHVGSVDRPRRGTTNRP